METPIRELTRKGGRRKEIVWIALRFYEQGSTESETPQLGNWQNSGGMGDSPGADSKAQGVLGPHGERWSLCWQDIW